MEDKAAKVSHVKRSRQSRNHECHWPGCEIQVSPAKWGCYHHWMRLPKHIRDTIWDSYEIGQEESLTPSKEYVKAARKAQDWIKTQGAS